MLTSLTLVAAILSSSYCGGGCGMCFSRPAKSSAPTFVANEPAALSLFAGAVKAIIEAPAPDAKAIAAVTSPEASKEIPAPVKLGLFLATPQPLRPLLAPMMLEPAESRVSK